ncbi:hypothetical protein RB595_003815 [Gaeumannomyces hyphopodioides]
MHRLNKPTGHPSRLSRLYLSNLLEKTPEKLDPVGPGATSTAKLFGLKTRPAKASRPKGDPGLRLAEADPDPWWEANKPKSFEHVSWDPMCSWEGRLHGMDSFSRLTKDPALVEGRGQMHTLLAEGSGHGNFESYHLRRVPAPWRRKPLLEANNTEEAKWWRRGLNAMVRIRVEKALKDLGATQVMVVERDRVGIIGQAPRVEDPDDSDKEEELPIVEVGRLA